MPFHHHTSEMPFQKSLTISAYKGAFHDGHTLNSSSITQFAAAKGSRDHSQPHCEGTPLVSWAEGEKQDGRVAAATHPNMLIGILHSR